MASGLIFVLGTAKEPTVKPPTQASGPDTAVVTLQQLQHFDSQSKPVAAGPAAHHRRPRHVFGLTAGGSLLSQGPGPALPPATLKQTKPAFVPSPHAIDYHHTSPVQGPSPQYPPYQTQLSPPAPGHRAPPESASFSRPAGQRSSKTSLGFISTPLIWQGRKRPTGGRRPVTIRAPPKASVHVTKPSEVTTPTRPTDATQTTEFKHSPGPGPTNATLHFRYATHTTVSAQPSPTFSHQPVSNIEFPTTEESSPQVQAAPLASSSSSLALGNRKNKPFAPQWSLPSISGENSNQTVAMENRTDPVETLDDDYVSGTEPFVYESADLSVEGGTFSLYELVDAFSVDEPTAIPPTFFDPIKSETHVALHPVTRQFTSSEGGSEHFLTQTHSPGDSENPPSGSTAGSKLSQTLKDRLMLETATLVSRSLTPTATVSHTSSSRQRLGESVYSHAAPQHLETLTFQPAQSLHTHLLSSLLLIQPTPSLPTAHLSSSAFPLSSSVPQSEDTAQISYSSLSLNPQDRAYETNTAGSDVELPAANSRLINNLYTFRRMHSSVHFTLHRPPLPPPPTHPPFFFTTSLSNTSPLYSLSPLPPFSPTAVTSQIPASPPPRSHNSLALPPLWFTAIPPPLPPLPPPPPSARPQPPPPFLPPSSQHAEGRLLETGGVVESAHVPESGGVSGNFQPSLLSSLSLSSSLQRDFVVTTVDTASSLSLPLFFKAATESLMSVVDDALLPGYHSVSVESSLSSTPGPFRGCLPSLEINQLIDAQSGPLVGSVNPTPSGFAMGNLASTSVMLTPAQPQVVLMLDPEFDPSVVLSPSSHAVSLSVDSHPQNQSDVGLTSLWASERTPALLPAGLHLAASSPSSSSDPFPSTCSPLLHHRDNNLLLTVSPETRSTAIVVQVARATEQMVGGDTAVSFSSVSPNPVGEESPLRTQASSERLASSLTFNRGPWRLQHIMSHLHTDNQVNTNSRGSQTLSGYDDAFNHPISPLSNPSVMAPTQALALDSAVSTQPGSATPQHASGLDYTYHSCLAQTNSEHPGHLIHTHSSAHTQMLTHTHKLKNEGQQQQPQSSHVVSFTLAPCRLSPSTAPPLSAEATLTPTLPSLHLSPVFSAIPHSISASSLLLPSWMPLPAVSANMAGAEIASLLPSTSTAGSHQPTTTTQSPLDKHLQSFQRSTTRPVSQSTESVQQSTAVSQSPPVDQAATTQELAINTQTVSVEGVVSSLEALNTQTTAGVHSHPSQLFYPARVVPKIHILDGHHAASTVRPGNSANSGLEPNEGLNPEVAPNTQLFPVEIQTTSRQLTSEPTYQPSYAPLKRPTGAQIIEPHTPDHTVPAAGSPASSSIDAPDQGFVSGLPPPASDNLTAGSKYISKSNVTPGVTLKDSASVAIEITNSTKDKNATTLMENGNMEASEGNVTGDRPPPSLSVNAGTSAESQFTLFKPGLNSGPSVSNHSGNHNMGEFVSEATDTHVSVVPLPPTLPTLISDNHLATTKNSSPTAPLKAASASAGGGGSSLKKATVRPTRGSTSAKSTLPCQCKQRFHFTCLCGLSPGNSMSCNNNKPVEIETQ